MVGELSFWFGTSLFGKMSSWENVAPKKSGLGKGLVGKLSFWFGTNLVGKMSGWENVGWENVV